MALERLGDTANEIGVFHSPDLDPYRIYLTRFTGCGREYFRIWIVNLLLSVLTLGIYSAWAKVRREQYFHRTLQLNGRSFEYHGQPLAILKGRLLVFAVFFALGLAQKANATAHAVLSICLLPAVPWLIVRALRFRAANTSYCGVCFAFHGSYREAAKVFFGYGLLTLLTLGLALPVWQGKLRAFMLNHLRYGSSAFRCELPAWQALRGTILPLLACAAGSALLGYVLSMAIWASSPYLAGLLGMDRATINNFGSAIGFGLMAALLWWGLPIVLSTRLTHLIWNHSHLGDGCFVAEIALDPFLKLLLRNWVLCLLSLGLFIPFSKVSQARFRAARLALVFPGALDAFTAANGQAAAAVGDEAADVLGVDLGL